MNHNHANYQARLDFVQGLLRNRLKLGASEITNIVPVQYDPESPFKYNNFVYLVTLGAPIPPGRSTSDNALQFGCVAIPEGTQELIVRLTNPATEGMNMANRVENEVAIISLASAALSGFQPHVVPRVYGWGSAAGVSADAPAQGWIVQELMPGQPLVDSFEKLALDTKKKVFAQMAALLKGLQKGLRQRLDKFVAEGVPAQFQDLQFKDEKVLTHADFNSSNLLWDPDTGRITALIDFDFATILHPSYEFLRSFSGTGGQFRGWYVDEESEEAALRDAKLHCFPSPLPTTPGGADGGGVNWEDAKAWEDALREAGVKRPQTIRGIDKVADVDTVLQAILPWRVTNSDVLKLQTRETILKCRDENEEHLDKLLRWLGF